MCVWGEGDAKKTKGEVLDVGVSDGARAALEDGSIEDEDAEKPDQTVNTPDDQRYQDVVVVGPAEWAVRMASSGSKRGNVGLT